MFDVGRSMFTVHKFFSRSDRPFSPAGGLVDALTPACHGETRQSEDGTPEHFKQR
jgi:hypothetical protein